MTIAVIGLGEVGRCLAGALLDAGLTVQLCEARPSAAAQALAVKAQLEIHAEMGEWLSSADWILSCVPGMAARDVARGAFPFLRSGQCYADLTTASPDTKRDAAKLAAETGIAYVDVAIMGSIAMLGFKTPLLASGPQSHAFCAMINQRGGRATAVEAGLAGDAIALKIMRSIFTKGLEALAVELLIYADQTGARAKLFGQLQDLDEMPLQTLLEGLVRTHVIHARRRAHEVHDAEREMAAHGLTSVVLPGIARRFEDTAAMIDGAALSANDVSIDTALAMLRRKWPDNPIPSTDQP